MKNVLSHSSEGFLFACEFSPILLGEGSWSDSNCSSSIRNEGKRLSLSWPEIPDGNPAHLLDWHDASGIYKLGLDSLRGLIALHKVFPRTYLILLKVPAIELQVFVVRKGYSEKKAPCLSLKESPKWAASLRKAWHQWQGKQRRCWLNIRIWKPLVLVLLLQKWPWEVAYSCRKVLLEPPRFKFCVLQFPYLRGIYKSIYSSFLYVPWSGKMCNNICLGVLESRKITVKHLKPQESEGLVEMQEKKTR